MELLHAMDIIEERKKPFKKTIVHIVTEMAFSALTLLVV